MADNNKNNKNAVPNFMLRNNGIDSGKADAYAAQKFAENFIKGFPGYRPAVVTKDDSGNVVQYSGWSSTAKEQQEYNKQRDEQREDAEKNAKPIEWKSDAEKETAINAAKALFKNATDEVRKDNNTTFQVTTRLENAEEQWTDDKLGHILPYSTEKEIINDNNALSTKLQLLWQKQYDGTATDEDYSAVAKYSKVLKARQQKLKEAFDKIDVFRTERESYIDDKLNGKNPLKISIYDMEADAITSDDGKIRYQNQVKTEFNNLWGKISGGTATDDDYRRYVNLDANYGVGLQKGFNALLDKSPDYHVSSVVYSWDKYGIPESEIWKDEEAYKADADKFGEAYNEAFEKYAKGELSEAELTAIGNEYKQLKAKEEVFFSPRWQNVGTTKDTETLKLERDNAAKAIDEAPKVFVADKPGEHSFLGGHFETDNKYQKPYDEASARYQSALDYEQLEKEAEESQKKIDEYKKSGFKLEPGELSGINVNNNSPDQIGASMATVPGKVKYSNVDEYLKALALTIYNDPNAPGAYELMTIADYGTDDEKATYAYLRQTKGASEADKYARGLAHTLGTRALAKSAEEYKNASNLERLLMGGISSVEAGLLGDNRYALEGIIKTVTGDTSYTPANVFQQVNAGHMAAEDNGIAKTAMQAVRSSSAQLPSMAAGLMGAGKIATALFTARSYGSARNDAINQGYSELEADGYALVSAGLEYASERLFDVAGIYGGTSLDDAVKASISKTIGNSVKLGSKTKTVLSTLAYLGLNGAGEAIEEGIVEFATPHVRNLIFGERNTLLDGEHIGEIGNAMLVGLVSAYISPASISTVSDAKANTAVWNVINGNNVTESQLNQIINNRDARSAFENYMGYKLSTEASVAKEELKAVNSAVAGVRGKDGVGTYNYLDGFNVSADSVMEYTEAVSDLLPDYDAEYVKAESERINEVLREITPEKIAAARVIDGTASSADVNSVAKNAEAKAYFATQTGVQLSDVPSEARNQIREYINSRIAVDKTVDKTVDNSENAVDTTGMTPSEAITAVAESTAEGTVRAMEEEASTAPAVVEASNGILSSSDVLSSDDFAVGKAVGENVQDNVVGEKTPAVSINDDIASDEELSDYAVSDEQAGIENTVANDERIIELRRQRDSGEITEAEYEDAVYEIISGEDTARATVTESSGDKMSSDEVQGIIDNSLVISGKKYADVKNDSRVKAVGAKRMRLYNAIGRTLGVNVAVFDGVKLYGGKGGAEGMYNPATRTVYLNSTGANKPLDLVFRHEVIHYLELNSPKAFAKFADMVITRYKAMYDAQGLDGEAEYKKWLDDKKAEYADMGSVLSDEAVISEFLAQHGMDMLQNVATVRQMVREDAQTMRWVQRSINAILDKVRRFLGQRSAYDVAKMFAELGGYVETTEEGTARAWDNRDYNTGKSLELLPEGLDYSSMVEAEKNLLQVFKEVAEVNKVVEQKLKKDGIKAEIGSDERTRAVNEAWSEVTGVKDDGKVMFSKAKVEDNKISETSTDTERTTILNGKVVSMPVYDGRADDMISLERDSLESEKIGLVKSAVQRIAEVFAPIGETIDIKDADVSIVLSRKNLKESVSKEATPVQLAKLFPVLRESLSNAIAIERHINRYYYDDNTVFFDNLLGAYINGDNIVPVRFGLKYSTTGQVTMYVVVDQNEIPKSEVGEPLKNKMTEVVNNTSPNNKEQELSRSVEYSISQIIPFVKSSDILRYLPDDMLDEEQLSEKWNAVAETINYTNNKNDKHYADFIRENNIGAANRMVLAAAKANGYSINTSDDSLFFMKKDENGDIILKSSDVITYDDDGNIIPISKRFNDKKNDVRWSKSAPGEVDGKAAKTPSLATVKKRNEVLSKRLADAKRQLKLTKAYSPDANQINDLAKRIAEDYNDGEDVKDIAKALTEIYTLWNKGSVTKNKADVDNANRRIAELSESILFGDETIADTESNNRIVSEFSDMLSTEISFIAEAEPTFADKSKAELDYQREMAEQDKKEAVAKEKLKGEQRAFEKAEKVKQKAEDKSYVEFWEKELDKIDKAKAKAIVKAEAEVERLNNIAAKNAMHDLTHPTIPPKSIQTELAEGLISTYGGNAKVSDIANMIYQIYRLKESANNSIKYKDSYLAQMDEQIDKLAGMFETRPGHKDAVKGEISNILAETQNEIFKSYDSALRRGEELKAEIDELANKRTEKNKAETDNRIAELRKEYSNIRSTAIKTNVKDIIAETSKWRGKSVEALVNTAMKLERQLQKDIAKMNAEKLRRRRSESKERQKLLKLMRQLKRVKTRPELMEAIKETVGDFDTVSMKLTDTAIEKLNTLNDEILKAKIANDELGRSTYLSPGTQAKLQRLEGKHIGDMTIEEVRSLTEALLEIDHQIKSENKMLGEGYKKTIRTAGNQIIDELNAPQTKTAKRFSKKSIDGKTTAYDALRPDTFFAMISNHVKNSVLYDLYNKVKSGSRDALIYKQQAQKKLEKFTKDEKYMETIIGKKAPGIELKDGVKINKASLIALFLHSKNAENLHHIETGGITVPDFEALQEGKTSKAYDQFKIVHLTEKEIRKLCDDNLNETDKALASAIWNYFNVTSKNALNKVSMEVYGYEKFNVENYFPIRVDTEFLNTDNVEMFDKEGNINILEKGFAQERKPGSIAPMILVDALTVFDRSTTDHSLYAHLAIPLRNMKSAFGVSKMVEQENGTYDSFSVWKALKTNWGSPAITYVEGYWKNLQNDVHKNLTESGFNAFAGRLATSALMLNAKSATKQFTAYPVALAEIGHKALANALKKFGRFDETRIERYNKYTPWLIQRSEGLSDATVSQLVKDGKGSSKLFKFTNWLQHTDVMTSKKLLKACEEWVKINNPKLDVNSEEFIKAAAAKFNDVIEKTQQNNDVISKTRRLANQTAFTRLFTMFKSQSYQQYNMYIEARDAVEAKKSALKNETEKKPVLMEEYKEAQNKFNLTREGLALSTSMNVLINLAFIMLRGRWDELDKDKDEEIEAWELILEFGDMYLDEFFGMYLYGDVVSYAKDKALSQVIGGTAFSPADNYAMTPFIDLIDKLGYFVSETAETFMGNDNNWYDLLSKTKALAIEGFEFAGIPANNLYNLITTSVYNGNKIATGSEDYAQIVRHLIKGDLLSTDNKVIKGEEAKYGSFNSQVRLALFNLHSKGKTELFDSAYGMLKFVGRSDEKIFDAVADGYDKRAKTYIENGDTEKAAEPLAYKTKFKYLAKVAGELDEIAETDEDKKFVAEYFEGVDKHSLPEFLKYASELYAKTHDDKVFETLSITATRDKESPKYGYISKDINGVTIGMKLNVKDYIGYVDKVFGAVDGAVDKLPDVVQTSEKTYLSAIKDGAAEVTKEYLNNNGSVILSDKEKWDTEFDSDKFNSLHMALFKLEPEDGKSGVSDTQKRKAILDSDFSANDKRNFYRILLGGDEEAWRKESDKIFAFSNAGLAIDDYLEARIKKAEIDDTEGMTAGDKASEFYSWARSTFGDAEAKVVYNTLPVSTGHKIEMSDVGAYKYADAGISAEKTDKIIDAISGLEPIKGADEVSDRQKIAAIDSVKGLTDEEKFKAYDLVFPKTSKEGDKLKYLTVNSTTEGFKLDYYFEMKEIGDRINKNNEVKTEKASGSGVSQDEITAAINELAKKHPKLTRADKGMLWQMYTGSSSTKNNPYDKNAGQKYLDSKK